MEANNRKVYCNFIDPAKPTPIPDNSYDALLCCAGFFQVHICGIDVALDSQCFRGCPKRKSLNQSKVKAVYHKTEGPDR